MKLAWTVGVTSAVVIHSAFLLFGGALFSSSKKGETSIRTVDLLGAPEDTKEEKKPEEPVEPPTEEQPSDDEPPPDAAEILRDLDAVSIDDVPALDAASLSAIEAALSGIGGSGDFAESLSFGSGGRIGGTGKFGAADDKTVEEAFSLAELDQEPRVVVQISPEYPNQMRGKKVEGVVSIFFFIDETGKVFNPRVEKSSHAAFESPALTALKKWKFEPGLRAGKPVRAKRLINIRFPKS